MANTNFTLLTTEQKAVWSRDLWKVARNAAFMTKFEGKSENSMIHRVTELTKTEKGDRAIVTLGPDAEGDGVVGDRTLKGNEEALKAYDKVIRIDQLRNAHKTEGRVADQKSIVRFRETAKDILGYWLADRRDQLAFLTLSGVSYAFKTDGTARTGSQLSLLEFAADVAAPSTYRRLRWDVGSPNSLITGAATTDVAVADMPSYEMIVALKAYAKDNFIKGVREGSEETYHLFMTPQGIRRLKMDQNYLDAMKHAQPRSDMNPLFTGAVAKIDGVYIHEFRHVYHSATWGGGSVAGQQALFLGAQALASCDLGPAGWVEEYDDYENQSAIAIDKMFGLLKPAFVTQYGSGAGTSQDFGAISCYTAV
jgi:N4-gp56 family major capsid protein